MYIFIIVIVIVIVTIYLYFNSSFLTAFLPSYKISSKNIANIKLPENFKVGIYAHNVPGARSMTIGGWLEGSLVWGRPVDIEIMSDGSMLVSDDKSGMIYRISYGS